MGGAERLLLQTSGTFFHVMWENQPGALFWNQVARKSSLLLSVRVPTTMFVFLLEDMSVFGTSKQQRKIVFAGLTTTKKMILTHWKSHSLHIWLWILSYLDVMELSTKQINDALWLISADSVSKLVIQIWNVHCTILSLSLFVCLFSVFVSYFEGLFAFSPLVWFLCVK